MLNPERQAHDNESDTLSKKTQHPYKVLDVQLEVISRITQIAASVEAHLAIAEMNLKETKPADMI